MQPPSSNRIKQLSTRFLGFYRIAGMGLLGALLAFIIGYAIVRIISGADSAPFFASIIYMWLMNKIITYIFRTYKVEFDDEFLYVLRKPADLLIPLENIKEVSIVSLGGIYKITLYETEQIGKEFYFKPSLIYPLNYKQKDKLVNQLREKIESAKRKKQTYQKNALMS
jgi:hypothetical protein